MSNFEKLRTNTNQQLGNAGIDYNIPDIKDIAKTNSNPGDLNVEREN